MVAKTLTYQKEKLYRLSYYMQDLWTKANSNFCSELEQTEALTEICEINNILEGILKDEE